jgi:hypothetical protein
MTAEEEKQKCIGCGRSDKPLVGIEVDGETWHVCRSFDCQDILYDELMKLVDRKHHELKAKKPKAPNKRPKQPKKKKKQVNRKYKPMNKPLQVNTIKRIIGEGSDLVDVEAFVDSTLSLGENLESLRDKGLVESNNNVEAQYEDWKREYEELYGEVPPEVT